MSLLWNHPGPSGHPYNASTVTSNAWARRNATSVLGSLLANMVERTGDVEVIHAPAPSKLALKWLKEGKIHIAGSHLEDPKTSEFNLPYIRREFGKQEVGVIAFAEWEEGFVVAPGNPKRILTVDDLVRRGVRFVNRQAGSDSRALLDSLLKKADIASKRIAGYSRVALGHLAAAYPLVHGDADCCRRDPLRTHSAWTSFPCMASVTILCFANRRSTFRQSSFSWTCWGWKPSPVTTQGKQAPGSLDFWRD